MDHLGGPGDHAERDGGLVGQPGGDHYVLLASHGSDTCTAAGVPPRGDGCTWRLAEQRRSARSWPLLISEVCSLHQDQVFGVGSRIQVD